jgi:hypothetical protein
VLRFHQAVTLAALLIVSPFLNLTARAEALKFAWPDGASAKVSARSEGRRVGTGTDVKWNMSADFTMQVRRAGDRVVISRDGFSGWKGTYPPSFGGGAERFTDMIPTLIVSADGKFIGIEGHETARKLINQSVAQSGGLDAMQRSVFVNMTTDASLGAMAKDHWSSLVGLWEDVELDPEASYELSGANPVPQLGGGLLEISGEVKFVKETPCASGGGQQRCAHFRAETAANREQVTKLVQSLLKNAAGGNPVITDWDQRIRVEIVVDKATTLPQQFTLTRFHSLKVRVGDRTEGGTEEVTKFYTFDWTLPGGGQKK